MPARNRTRKTVRRSISISSELDRKVQHLARAEKRSTNQVVEALVEAGLEAREAEKQRFFQLAERLRTTSDPDELRRIKEELARMTFGS